MSFTYVLSTNVGKVRLKLGDHTSGQGKRPSSANFSDEELQVFLDEEGSVAGAIAAACEALTNEWSDVASIQIGQRREEFGEVAAKWAKRASDWRARQGGGTRVRRLARPQNIDDGTTEYTT